MPDTVEPDVDVTETALKAVNVDLQRSQEPVQESVVETHPDVWNEQGRLISHPFNTVA